MSMGTRSIKGTEIQVGMVRVLGWKETAKVLGVVEGRHPMGARYADVEMDNGDVERCWEAFQYRILTPIRSGQPAE
jgi:hypothetical protein